MKKTRQEINKEKRKKLVQKNLAMNETRLNIIPPLETYIQPKHGHVHPFYSTNADYNTDSASYYDYLAKFNDILQALINQVNENSKNIEIIFDKLDDLQAQINIINGRLDIIEDDIENIYNLIDEINAKIDLINNKIDEINREISLIKGDIVDIKGDITNIKGDISDIQDDIKDIYNKLSNIYTKRESAQRFTKSITQYRVPENFNMSSYTGKSFAQMFHDFVTMSISEFYPPSTPGSDLIRIFLDDGNTIATHACLNLLTQFYGISESDVSTVENPMSFMVVAEFSASNFNIPSKVEILANDFNDIFVFIIDIKTASNPDLNNLKNSDFFKVPKIWASNTI